MHKSGLGGHYPGSTKLSSDLARPRHQLGVLWALRCQALHLLSPPLRKSGARDKRTFSWEPVVEEGRNRQFHMEPKSFTCSCFRELQKNSFSSQGLRSSVLDNGWRRVPGLPLLILVFAANASVFFLTLPGQTKQLEHSWHARLQDSPRFASAVPPHAGQSGLGEMAPNSPHTSEISWLWK